MNAYVFEEIAVGLTESFEVTVTEDMFAKFLAITGDVNPLHNDAVFAEGKGHPSRVAFGMLTASFLSTLAGVYLPGKNSLIHEVEVKFAKPVYAGDVLKISGTVSEINETFKLFWMKVTITNQKGEKVLRGKMRVGVLDERE